MDILDEIGHMEGGCVYADKEYSSQLNPHVLQARGLADGIMYEAARNRALGADQKAANRLVSSIRAKVERAFGTLKRGNGFFRTRYLGVAKVELEFLLNAMALTSKRQLHNVWFQRTTNNRYRERFPKMKEIWRQIILDQ